MFALFRFGMGAAAPCLALGFSTLACEITAAPSGSGVETAAAVDEFVNLVNAHRESVGCQALTWHEGAAAVARAHSADMVARSFFSHNNPDGLSPFDRLDRAGIPYRAAGENIATGYASAEAVLGGWLDSPGHRANIENCGFTHHGLGLVDSHWTHLFLTPQ
jgi:uncharacterized protein YkwD